MEPRSRRGAACRKALLVFASTAIALLLLSVTHPHKNSLQLSAAEERKSFFQDEIFPGVEVGGEGEGEESGCGGEEEDGRSEGKSDPHSTAVEIVPRSNVLGIITVLVLLSIGFEFAREYIDERTEETFKVGNDTLFDKATSFEQDISVLLADVTKRMRSL